MDPLLPLDRRTFLADMGRGTFALAVISVVGSGPSGGASATAASALVAELGAER